jgi:hypothetical protein
LVALLERTSHLGQSNLPMFPALIVVLVLKTEQVPALNCAGQYVLAFQTVLVQVLQALPFPVTLAIPYSKSPASPSWMEVAPARFELPEEASVVRLAAARALPVLADALEEG